MKKLLIIILLFISVTVYADKNIEIILPNGKYKTVTVDDYFVYQQLKIDISEEYLFFSVRAKETNSTSWTAWKRTNEQKIYFYSDSYVKSVIEQHARYTLVGDDYFIYVPDGKYTFEGNSAIINRKVYRLAVRQSGDLFN